MSSLATRRLIDAAAALDPAERALLNLWVNRGLGDERLTELTGMSFEALGARREKIVARLAAELGLPEPDVRGALEQISPDEQFMTSPDPEEIALEPSAPNGGSPPTAGETTTEALRRTPHSTSTETRPAVGEPGDRPPPVLEPPPGSGRRRVLWPGLAAMAVAVAVVVVVIAAGGSFPRRSRSAHRTHPASAAATPSPRAVAPSQRTVPAPLALAGLPGGLAHASGMVKLSGSVRHLSLDLTVRGLPPAHRGHHEVWLYNSVLDSRPLARLRTGHRRLVARLPAAARRYRWIDISFQSVGAVNHSGESELRASNPAHTTEARLRRRSSRTRHRLRQASKVSAAHPASHPRRETGPRTERQGRRAQAKRSASGSKRSNTAQ